MSWVNKQTQLIITKAEFNYNNKHTVTKQHIVKYDNVKNKLNMVIELHAISIKSFADTLVSIDTELKSINRNIIFTLNNYSNYAKKKYKIVEFVNIKNGSIHCFVEADMINLLLEQSKSPASEGPSNNESNLFLEQLKSLVTIFGHPSSVVRLLLLMSKYPSSILNLTGSFFPFSLSFKFTLPWTVMYKSSEII